MEEILSGERAPIQWEWSPYEVYQGELARDWTALSLFGIWDLRNVNVGSIMG